MIPNIVHKTCIKNRGLTPRLLGGYSHVNLLMNCNAPYLVNHTSKQVWLTKLRNQCSSCAGIEQHKSNLMGTFFVLKFSAISSNLF